MPPSPHASERGAAAIVGMVVVVVVLLPPPPVRVEVWRSHPMKRLWCMAGGTNAWVPFCLFR